MEAQTKVCQNCKVDFVIDSNDFGYYKKIGVLPPKMCPECRAQLRLTFRNERFFYKRKCDNCGVEHVSMYSPDKKYPVWCHSCWWGNDLDGSKYAQDYDPNRPFLDQFNELWQKVPKPSLVGFNNVNCQYMNFTADNKDCYMVIESSNNENCTNCYWIQLSKDLVDCSFTQKVELSYDVDDCYDSHSLNYSKGCHNCFESSFLLNCRNSNNCLGCVNLRGKSYCIFNQEYTKEEYEKKLASYRLDTYSGVEKFRKEFEEFLKDKPRKFAEIYNAVNSSGSYMTNVKNNKHCFHSYDAEDNAYCVHAWRGAKDCMDCSTAGRTVELVYNSVNVGLQATNVICSFYCWGSQFMDYCLNCPNSNNCFGCVGLIKGSYSILNKKYSKEEYEKLRGEIIEKMKADGIYGEFFPKEFSPHGYNECCAIDEYPLSKEEAITRGFQWQDTQRGTYGKETIDWKTFPDSIKDLPSDFDAQKEIFVCLDCSKNYRLTNNELTFYRRRELPVPRNCPECRHNKRFEKRGPNKLWTRSCMNSKAKCEEKFETNYSPESEEIIFCEKCYHKEVY